VRRELLAKQSGTALTSRFGVLLEHVSNAPSAHRLTPKIDEHLWCEIASKRGPAEDGAHIIEYMEKSNSFLGSSFRECDPITF
jgi:hypothetical protein